MLARPINYLSYVSAYFHGLEPSSKISLERFGPVQTAPSDPFLPGLVIRWIQHCAITTYQVLKRSDVMIRRSLMNEANVFATGGTVHQL